jgi:hypothetical protein
MNIIYDLVRDSQLPNNQGHWWTQLSANQVATRPQLLQQQHEESKQKKKSRGNRKEQHRRRRLRRREQKMNGINTDNNNNMDINNYDMCGPQIQDQSTKAEKRKHHASTNNEMQVNKSLSQLSISQRNPKKKKTTTSDRLENHDTEELHSLHQKKQTNEQPVNQLRKFVPPYLNVSDKIFKEMLSATIKDGDKVVQSLNTNENLQFIRQMTQLVNTSNYILLQKDLWQTYNDFGMKDGTWPTRISKQSAREHNTCQMVGQPQHFVEQRLETVERQMRQVVTKLQQYFIELSFWTQQCQPPIDVNLISEVINKCVENGQKRLRNEFNYKKTMLQCDYDDHQAITKFYMLNPNEEQVCGAKQ